MNWAEKIELGKQNMHFPCSLINLKAGELYVTPSVICEIGIGEVKLSKC
jgi:hypothetical protein